MRPSRRSTRSGPSAGSPNGPPNRTPPSRSRPRWPRRPARRSAGGPDRPTCRSPRTFSTSRCPTTSRPTPPGRAVARDRRRDPRRHRAARLRPPTGHPGRRRRPARPDLDRADPFRRAAPGAGHRRLAPRGRHLERPSAVSRHGRLRGRGVGQGAPRRRRRPAGHRLPPQRGDVVRLHDAAPGLRWAHVDLAPGAPSAPPAPEIAVAADAKAFLKAANERLVGRAVLDAALVAERQAANREDRAAYEAASVVDAQPWDGPGVHPGRSITTLRGVLPDDAILTSDAGNFATGLGRGFRFRRPGTFLGPTSGAMGYGLPAAIAAALVHRDRPVVAVCGDGGLAMTMSELETAVRVGARVIVVVFDNERYGTIRMWQEERGTRDRRRHGARSGRLRGDRAGLRCARRARGSRRRLRTGPARGARGRSRDGHPAGARPGVASIDLPPG